MTDRAVDLKTLKVPYRAVLVVRDPRDLIVSGYFYHRAGKEAWTHLKDPPFRARQGVFSPPMTKEVSFFDHLQSLSQEDGLLAELSFREGHFLEMRKWNLSQDNLIVVKYEEIVGNEIEAFSEICKHYEFPNEWADRILYYADAYSAKNQQGNRGHIRDAKPKQWASILTDKVVDVFDEHWTDLLVKFGYQ